MVRYRTAFNMSYRTWHMWHAVMAMVVYVTALMHAVLVNYYLALPEAQVLWMGLSGLFFLAAVWMPVCHAHHADP